MRLEHDARHITLEGAFNIRDLGGYRLSEGRGLTQLRRVLRADSPHRLTGEDLDILLETGLRTVIDLRASHEAECQPNPFEGLNEIEYLHLPLFDALSPTDLQGNANERNPLPAFYAQTLARRQPQIRDILTAIAEAPSGAVLFHCTAGKDRTGLIAALVLGNADVVEDDIVADYARTAKLISPLVAEFLNLAARKGELDIEAYRRVLTARPETMHGVLEMISKEYGSIADYVASVGLDQALRTRLSNRLIETS